MSEDPCLSFRAALAASSADASEFPLESARHLNGCEACQEWLDGQDLPDGASDAALIALMSPLMEALARLEAEAEPSPTQIAFAEARAREERDLDAAVRGFIARHPELDPAKHGIDMERFEHAAFFSALNAVNMLIRRVPRRYDPSPKSCGLRADGAVFLDGVLRVPASSVRNEIGRFIVHDRKVPPEEMTDDLAEAFRREAAWRDDETCARLSAWIVAAVRCKADLMRNFRMIGVDADDPQVVVLEPIRTGTDDRDAIGLWNE